MDCYEKLALCELKIDIEKERAIIEKNFKFGESILIFVTGYKKRDIKVEYLSLDYNRGKNYRDCVLFYIQANPNARWYSMVKDWNLVVINSEKAFIMANKAYNRAKKKVC